MLVGGMTSMEPLLLKTLFRLLVFVKNMQRLQLLKADVLRPIPVITIHGLLLVDLIAFKVLHQIILEYLVLHCGGVLRLVSWQGLVLP